MGVYNLIIVITNARSILADQPRPDPTPRLTLIGVDFVMASALHQDTRYARRGPAYGGVWARARYAIASAFVTHTNSGGRVFNWSNLAGTALSTSLSDLYYPPSGRKINSMSIRFGTNVVSNGLAALFPEFWPDFRDILRRHHLIPRRH